MSQPRAYLRAGDWGSFDGLRARAMKLGENRARYGHQNFCERCRRIRRRVEVDHVIPRRVAPELVFELSNLQVLCRACHKIKTREDRAVWAKF